ncbi:NAD(P)/FAD-dependent oxidoreductase [Hwanghaeella grinnelliae]|uniref:NAD(P)/FAD-dependent oxidoreductase n=1 Tax=Hwanghaeella grinnelliae TaxID=2500179 RepID=A0A437QWY9_9PROT|nr:NAD(P)/FAD-dependent oxidoreductase [Hwanghaeella grinnelliae]RVU38953.1 NAD(P)/FAD-dependent oxidoreductase [Hwanghaeella grinnelliae]
MSAIETTQALVIGAGLSGLAAARELTRRGLQVTVVEARDRVAEPWRGRHPALRLNIHRHFASLPGMAMTDRDGHFVKRDTVVDYLESYAAALDTPIRYGVEVTGFEKTDGGWRVTTNGTNYDCSHVIVATGRDRVPHIPDWPGLDDYQGEVLHAADLGDVSRFDDKRVLVVGAGNSGADVLNHLSRHRPARVWIAVRHGPAVVPARIFGFPLHRLARVFTALPLAVVDPAFRLTQRLFLGNLAKFGLSSHPDGGGTRLLRDGIAFAIDDGFAAAIRSYRFRMVGDVAGFARDRVYVKDGKYFAPDVVICATGYRTGLGPLLGRFGVLDGQGEPRHPRGEADPENPGLWFTGFRSGFTGYFDAAAIAARRIADGVATDLPHTVPAESDRKLPNAGTRANRSMVTAARGGE